MILGNRRLIALKENRTSNQRKLMERERDVRIYGCCDFVRSKSFRTQMRLVMDKLHEDEWNLFVLLLRIQFGARIDLKFSKFLLKIALECTKIGFLSN